MMASFDAATSSRARRSASTPCYALGFYRAVSMLSSADVLQGTPTSSSRLRVSSTDDLPADCYLVEKLIAERKQKVWFNNNTGKNNKMQLKNLGKNTVLSFMGRLSKRGSFLGCS